MVSSIFLKIENYEGQFGLDMIVACFVFSNLVRSGYCKLLVDVHVMPLKFSCPASVTNFTSTSECGVANTRFIDSP